MRPLLAFALLLLSIASAYAQPATHDDHAAIRAVIQQTEAANNAGDVDAWVALFADDAVYMAPGAPAVTTRAGLIDVARAGFVHEADIRITPDEIEVMGDWAFARSHVTGTVVVHGSGEVVDVDVKQIAIYRKGEDGWKIARLITNSNG